MARFILDVNTENIQEVMGIIERDIYLADKVASIRCIDETTENQFYDEGENGTNQLSEKQIENDKFFFNI